MASTVLRHVSYISHTRCNGENASHSRWELSHTRAAANKKRKEGLVGRQRGRAPPKKKAAIKKNRRDVHMRCAQ